MRNPHYLLVIPITLFIGFILLTQKHKIDVIPASRVRIIAEHAYNQADKKNFDTSPEIVLKKGEFYFFEQNHPLSKCHVQTKESRIFPSAKKTECIDVVCTLSLKNQKTFSTLRAPKAYINQADKIIFFPGTTTEQLKNWHGTKKNAIYNAKKQIITAHKTTLQSKKHNIFMKSDKSMTNIKNESITLQNNVITVFTTNS